MSKSAFGIEHGDDIAKGLKPRHLDAMKRVGEDRSLGGWKKAQYARDRVNLHGISEYGKTAERMTISRGMYKKPLGRLTRVKRSDRDKNRKPIFGDSKKV